MKKIMIVDDDSDLLFMLKSALLTNGYSVTALSDGSAAVRAIEMMHPDIVILDIHMPPWDGREICRTIKNIPALQHIPVVLYSALPEDREAMANCQANLFLQKPLSTREFVDQISAMMPQ